jgi:phage-related protein
MPILSELFTKVIEPALPYIEDFAAGIANVVTALFDAGPASTEMREALTGLFGEELGGKIADIVTKVTDFATSVSTFVTETLVPFLSEHGPLLLTILQGVATGLAAFAIINTVVGLVTGLVTTIGTLSAAFTAAGGGIAAVVGLLGGPLTVAIAAIALIVGLFTIAWKNNWFGIRDIVANIWASIQPVFQTIVQWLQTNIPLAIQTLTNFWTNTLLPAIQAIWNFLQTYIIPLFVSLARLIITVVVTAFNILVAIFQNILLPIFRTVFSFISEKLSPVFKVLGEGITKFVNGAGKALKGVFEDIKNIIQTVIDFIQKLIDKIKNIKLPPILQRHSPSPFEMTFIGAAEAIKELTSLRLPALETGLGRVASSSYTSSGEKASPSSLGGSQIVLSVMPGAIVIQAGAGADTRKIADEVLTYLGKDLRRLVQSGSGWVGG